MNDSTNGPGSSALEYAPHHEMMRGVDQLFFQCERYSDKRVGGIGVYVLDRMPAWDKVEYTFERLSREFLRLRQRVVEPIGGIGPAYWAVDPDFDIKYHLRRIQLSAGTPLRTVVDRLEVELMSPFDLARPLWYAMLFEGLEGGRSALALYSSHAVGDGMAGQKMLPLLFDSSRHASRRSMPPVPITADLSSQEVSAKMRRWLPRAAIEGVGDLASSAVNFGGRLLRHPKVTTKEVRELVESLQSLSASSIQPSPLLAGRSISRRVTWIELSLQDLKQASKAAGGTVNDGFLAGLSGALGRYHQALGMPLDTIPVVVPISIRAKDSEIGGNYFTHGLLVAPIGEPDPERRVRDIHDQIQRERDKAHYDFTGFASRFIGYMPPAIVDKVLGSASAPDLQASNVPGAREDLFLAGARVEKTIGIGPVAGLAMMAGLTSHQDAGTVTVTYDPAAIRDAKLFQKCLERGFAEILDFAPRSARRSTSRRPQTRASRSRGATRTMTSTTRRKTPSRAT